MQKLSRLSVVCVVLAASSPLSAEAPKSPTAPQGHENSVAVGTPVRYSLPKDGPLPKTYRVTLAAAPRNDPDFVVATFVAGGARTVTAENGGQFTDLWDGLDDNGLPVPPGEYVVKGVWMPAMAWKIDGQPHTLIPRYRVGAGDSWSPDPTDDARFPWVFGHVFGYMNDVAVGPNGKAGFLGNYIENAWNPFLVDLNKPIGYDQVVRKFDSGGTAGGPCVACNGEQVWYAGGVGPPFLYRGDRGMGTDVNENGARGVKLPAVPASLVAHRDAAIGRTRIYAALPTPADVVLVLDGDSGETLARVKLQAPKAVAVADAPSGLYLWVLHQAASGKWEVVKTALKDGLPSGEWAEQFALTDIIPGGCAVTPGGRFYVTDAAANQLYELDGKGAIVRKFGRAAKQTPGKYDSHVFMTPTKAATWRDGAGKDRILVVEAAGPGRVSEWSSDGELIRQWFFNSPAETGYCADPADPGAVYCPTATGTGMVRYRCDYATGTWAVDAVWPDIAVPGQGPDGGRQYPRIINHPRGKFLAFAGGANGGFGFNLYRQDGLDWKPAAGLVVDAGSHEG